MKLSANLLILLLFALVLTGCGLFDTRDPDNPVGSQSPDDLALSPEEVLTQLETAFTLHDPNLYMAAISGDFSFSATLSAFPEDPGFFADWSFAREDVFIRSLLAPALLPPDSSAELSFEAIDEISFADSAVFRESYRLEIAPADDELPTLYEGLADLVLKREEDGGWRLVLWVDDAGGEAPAISQLKAAL